MTVTNSTNPQVREAALYQSVKNCYDKARESLMHCAQFKKSIKLLIEGSEEYIIAHEILEMELNKTKYYLRQYDKNHKERNAVCRTNQFAHHTTDLDKILTETTKNQS